MNVHLYLFKGYVQRQRRHLNPPEVYDYRKQHPCLHCSHKPLPLIQCHCQLCRVDPPWKASCLSGRGHRWSQASELQGWWGGYPRAHCRMLTDPRPRRPSPAVCLFCSKIKSATLGLLSQPSLSPNFTKHKTQLLWKGQNFFGETKRSPSYTSSLIMQPEHINPTRKLVGHPGLQNASPYALLMFKEPSNFHICYLKPSVATDRSFRDSRKPQLLKKRMKQMASALSFLALSNSDNNRA